MDLKRANSVHVAIVLFFICSPCKQTIIVYLCFAFDERKLYFLIFMFNISVNYLQILFRMDYDWYFE